MKKLVYIITGFLLSSSVIAQQLPFSESYFLDKYSLSSAYAGNSSNKSLFTSYRRDWSGLGAGPRTFRLSYSDGYNSNTGIGGKMIIDRAGIFQQFFALATYTYKLEFVPEHFLFFGLSAGIYRNSLNLSDYYNDPQYNFDPSLISKDVKSKVKFITDYSLVYSFNGIQAGVLFTNVNFGESSYKEVDLKYKPLSNFQLHATYEFNLKQDWNISPMVIVRGGGSIKTQLELASQVMYKKKVWGTLIHRGKGVWGFGIGANVYKSIVFNYNYNVSSNIAVNSFQNHEITLGINLGDFMKKD